MNLIKNLIQEVEAEAEGTEKMLSRVPADKLDWQPHEKSMTLGQLTSHIATLSHFVGAIVSTDILDLAHNNLPKIEIKESDDLVKAFNSGVEKSLKALRSAKEEDIEGTWTLKKGDYVIMKSPKITALRQMALNHPVHHRGQLSVYLRLLDVPVPGMYGPSADDKG